MDCPEEEILLAFLAGRLSPDDRAALEDHLTACMGCREVLASVAPIVLPKSSSAVDPLSRGASVGRYLILELVGRGGMGEVYAAYDPELDRKVALKLLRQQTEEDAAGGEGAARLLREAQAIARLSHPNVVTVHDAGTHGEQVFIAMEFIEGQTLAGWLGGRSRPWKEIKDLFLGAGRGLEAAHGAGLVHRDFKPHNVMVSRDGGPRVMDFGLASDGGDAAPQPRELVAGRDDTAPESLRLTRTGTLLGTPAYMAPEQFRTERADARSDQFSFCVTLYEALYGERPFAGTTIADLTSSVMRGRVREAPSRSGVPSWLRRVVLRGLQPDRQDRFLSMRELLAALADNPVRRRRRVLLAGAVAAALLGGGMAADKLLVHRGAALCRGATPRLATAWERADGDAGAHSRRGAARAAFLASGRANAADTWQRVAAVLDGYAESWGNMYRDTCEATHVRGEQSLEVMDLRMDCLGRDLQSLRALTDVFATADSAVVGQAVSAASSLPELERCADVGELRALVPPPRDPQVRARVNELRQRAAEIRALGEVGRCEQALARALPLVDEARQLRYEPLSAEIYALVGWMSEQAGDLQKIQPFYMEALWAAEASRHDEIAAEAAIQLTATVGWLGRKPDEARNWGRLGEAILARMGPTHERLKGWLAHNRAIANVRAGEYREARAEAERAIAFKQRAAPGPGREREVATSLNVLGLALVGLGDPGAALEAVDRGLAIYDRVLGPGSELGALMLNNRGDDLLLLGRHAEALAAYRQAVATLEANNGPSHPWLSAPLTGSGRALVALGRPAEAIPVLEQAFHVRREEAAPEDKAETELALASALWDAGRDRVRALTLAAAARDDYGRAPNRNRELADATSWLSRHTLQGVSKRR